MGKGGEAGSRRGSDCTRPVHPTEGHGAPSGPSAGWVVNSKGDLTQRRKDAKGKAVVDRADQGRDGPIGGDRVRQDNRICACP